MSLDPSESYCGLRGEVRVARGLYRLEGVHDGPTIVPLDLLCASGTSYFGRPAVPYVPGVQGVGVIETSPTLDPGTRVWFATSAGMAAGNGSLAAREKAEFRPQLLRGDVLFINPQFDTVKAARLERILQRRTKRFGAIPLPPEIPHVPAKTVPPSPGSNSNSPQE